MHWPSFVTKVDRCFLHHNKETESKEEKRQPNGIESVRFGMPIAIITPDFADSQNCLEYCKILQNFAEFCRILQNFAEFCRIMQNFAEICRNLKNYAEI